MEEEDEFKEEGELEEATSGARPSPGAGQDPWPVRAFFPPRITDFKSICILLLNFPFGPEVCINTGHNDCTIRSDQDLRVETVFSTIQFTIIQTTR